MITDELAARTIAHLRTRRDKKSKQLAEEIYAKSYALHPTCENCKLFKPDYGFNDEGFCIKHKKLRNCSAQKPCFEARPERQKLASILNRR